jgi:multicomponent Na+:H+ antiporter subunit A
VTLVLLPGSALLATTSITDDVRAYDNPAAGRGRVVIAVAAVLTARAHRRFTAVLYLGAVGYGIAVLFVLQGGPDLALTQFLVETLALVIFVFVLRRLPGSFSRRPLRLSQGVRLVVALVGRRLRHRRGAGQQQARTAPPASQAYSTGAARGRRQQRRQRHPRRLPRHGHARRDHRAGGRRPRHREPGAGLARAAPRREVEEVSVMSSEALRRVGHPRDRRPAGLPHGAVFSLYLLFAGHNQPGGGFVGGLVGGLAFVLRYLAGGARALDEAVPLDPSVPLGSACAGRRHRHGAVAVRRQFLESAFRSFELPLLGAVKATSRSPFDMRRLPRRGRARPALLRTLGAEAER